MTAAPRRQCGDCQLCCKLLPMQEFAKPAGERCPHQRHAIGCNIYPRRPHACRLWNCRWLAGDSRQWLLSHGYRLDIGRIKST